MDALKSKIKELGNVLPGNILKVDAFLNHQVDPTLMMEMGQDFADRYANNQISKVLTLEVSGIAMALTTANALGVPMIFAKKIQSLTLDDEVFVAQVYSYTKETTYDIRVDKRFLNPEDNVLIIDDFLANGEALKGLIELVEQSGANVGGIGIAIEKTFQEGGKKVREMGYPIYSQARIKSLTDGKVEFDEDLDA
ncbi:xanthine phosphoribosyltransferase [Aerococcaceae bacterium DSM 111020]|nr:xanthine phosphoribosyltransferase [Aerococcaceae bacterium DSM 111020]